MHSFMDGFNNSLVTTVGAEFGEFVVKALNFVEDIAASTVFIESLAKYNIEKAFLFSVFRKTLVCASNFLYSRKFSLVKLY